MKIMGKIISDKIAGRVKGKHASDVGSMQDQ